MSAKGRGRHEGGSEDYYPTPAWAVHRLLDDCGSALLPNRDLDALEPTCGDGAIATAAQSWHGERLGTHRWTGVELRRGALASTAAPLYRHHEGVDYRAWEAPTHYHVALGNPPFALAESIIRRALSHASIVAMLLRVSFLGTEERVDFFRGVGRDPALRILPERPSFDGIGTDASTYAWFVWGAPDVRGNVILGSTPKSVRRAQTPQGIVAALQQGRLAL